MDKLARLRTNVYLLTAHATLQHKNGNIAVSPMTVVRRRTFSDATHHYDELVIGVMSLVISIWSFSRKISSVAAAKLQ